MREDRCGPELSAGVGEGEGSISRPGDHSTGDAQQGEEANLILTLIDYNERGLGAVRLLVEVSHETLMSRTAHEYWPRGEIKRSRLVQPGKSVDGSMVLGAGCHSRMHQLQ